MRLQACLSYVNLMHNHTKYHQHYLDYSFASNSIVDFYDDAAWICYVKKDYSLKERIMLFKTDVIKPLCDYVIDELRKNVSLLYVLDRFKNRTMRFESPYLKGYAERDVQNKLALYLFDSGYIVHREENISNGQPDFLFSDEDKNSYIIEVKYITNKVSNKNLKAYTSQLKDYVSKLNSHIGVLCIFTKQDYEFTWLNKPHNLEILTIYVGELNPSERNTKIISLDFNSGL